MALSDKAEEIIRREIIRHYINQGLHTDLDVQEFLLALKEPRVGTKHNCTQTDHCAQLRPVADMLTGRVDYGLVWTNRTGSKTYLFGGLDTWFKSCTRPHFETKILGGSEDQSKLSYKAMDDFWRISGLEAELLATESRGGRIRKMLSSTEWKNGAEASILTASQKSVRGPHPNCLKLDEVDEIDEGVYQAALSQPVSKHGFNSSLWLFSTNHNVGGMMDKALATAKDKGTAIYKYCYDKETEVLTKRGWMLFKDVCVDDKILSLNPNTQIPEWTSITEQIKYHYSGKMVEFKGRKVDLLVTPNHKMYVCNGSKTRQWGLETASDVLTWNEFRFFRGANWKGTDLPTILVCGKRVKTETYCKFMGWFLSEGCAKADNLTVFVGQSIGVNTDKYVDILDCVTAFCSELGHTGKIGVYPNGVSFCSKEINKYLQKFGKSLQKWVPDVIKQLSPKYINMFLEKYRLGDGSSITKYNDYQQVSYYTSSTKMMADLGELILKTGKFPSYTKTKQIPTYWHVRETQAETVRCYKNEQGGFKWKFVDYDDMVYCVSLEKNHILFVRRNGRCAWQGNCVWEVLQNCKDYVCGSCPLTTWCPGKHMKEADGYYSIQDFNQKLMTMSMSHLMREWFCIKVGLGDLVYEQEWDEELHVKGMPKYNPALPCVLSIDWGGTNPFSVGVWQHFTELNRWVRVAEVFLSPTQESATNSKLLKICKAKPWWRNVTDFTADPARPDLIQEWEDAFYASTLHGTVAFHPHEDRDVDTGIEAVKAALRPVSGEPTIGVHYSCLYNRREYTQYKTKKINENESKIVKESDHTMDDTRLFVCQFVREGGGGIAISDDSVDVSPE